MVGVAVLAGLLGGCALGPAAADRAMITDDPKLYGIAERDRVLWQYRLGLQALRLGRDDEAKARLDDAVRLMGGIIADSESARRARSRWAAEREKFFIGEPYERAMAYYYRGILYWRDGEPDNARACFRSAQFIDGVAEGAQHRGDYALLEYLDGLASVKLGADGSDALARADQLAGRPLPAIDAQRNVLVFAEWGAGPRKVAGGPHGEWLRFERRPTAVHRALLTVKGESFELRPWEDLAYQATTRGGRVMDHILGNKAVFKEGASLVGDAALAGAAVSADRAKRKRRQGEDADGAEDTAMALAAVGVLGKAAAAATDARADTRTWDNLPQYLSFTTLRLPPGEHAARVAFFDAEGKMLEDRTRYVIVQVAEDGRDTVVFVSDLGKKSS